MEQGLVGILQEMKSSARLTIRTTAIVGITLLALALGGSTALWAQAVIIILAATVILFFPPRLGLGTVPIRVSALFLGLALCAFLPVGWFFMPAWRRHLTQDLHVPLGIFLTPQPWLTLQACGLLLFGLVWTCYLFAQEWSAAEKSQAMRLFVVGMVLLAAATITAYWTNFRIPGWNQEQNRGWFPNRNQTADVLALGGIINYAIAFRCLQKRRWTGGLWLTGLGIICGALVVSYSRAGILMFFGGVGLWHLGSIFRPGDGKRLALGGTFLLIFLSLFLLFGGSTLERFMKEPDNPYTTDYRMLIQEDALRVSLHSPLFGVGLGNFEPVFTSMREASADQNRTLHPESDWLWMVVEMGWIAPLLLLLGLWWWVDQCLPFALESGEALRRAAVVAVGMFVVHGFVDVSGHRLGSMGVAIFLAGVAVSPHRQVFIRPWVAPLFRALAGILILLGAWWLGSLFTDHVPPTTASLGRIETRLNLAASEGRLATVAEEANKALAIAPLDWTFYFHRATAEAFRTGATGQATTDFNVARFLEPHWIQLCLNEGKIWLAAGEPHAAIEAWREALRRAGPQAASIYATMLGLSQDHPEVHGDLRKLADTNIDYLVTFLNFATPEEVNAELDGLLARDSDLHLLNYNQRQKLFSAWFAHGDQATLAEYLRTHEEGQKSGWPFLAQYFASRQNFEMACLTKLRYMPPPVIPSLPANQPLAQMQRSYEDHPGDLVEGVMLCQAQIQKNRLDEALATLATLEKRKDHPRYLFYLEAQLDVKKQQWEQAWAALQQMGGM